MNAIHRKAHQRLLLAGFLFSSTLLPQQLSAQSQIRAVVPSSTSAHTNRFYSPGVDAGDYVYVSGQGPRRPDGSSPSTFDAQVRLALDNVKAVVEAAGLTMEHVVYAQVYLEDTNKYGDMNRAFAEYFPRIPPARAVLGGGGHPRVPRSD